MKNRKYFPLSLSQLNLWAVEQSCPGTSVNVIGTTLHIHGRFDPIILQQSINSVLQSDSSLRTMITMVDGEPVQYHAEYEKSEFPLYDFSMSSAEGVENWESAVTREAMPLFDAPLYRFALFRLGEQDGGLLIKLHHIISDGWSQVLLCNRIGQLYLDILAGESCEMAPSPDYEEYVHEEEKYLESPSYARDEAYWKDVLSRAGEPSAIKAVNSAVISHVGRRKSFHLPQSLNNKIFTFCTQNRLSPFSALYLALAVYFRRIGGANRFTIGVPVFNRTSFSFKQTSGMFVSTLPFFNELDGEWSLNECCDRMNEQWFEMLRHQRMPFSHIQELATDISSSGHLFNIVLSYQNGQMLTSRNASVSFSGRWHYSGYQMEHLCIHLNNLADNRRYAIDYDYLTQVFTDREIDALHTSLMNILSEGLEAPDKPIHALPVLSRQEKEKVIYTFNNTDAILYDNDVYDRFLRTAERHPERAAVIYSGERTSFRQLEKMAENVHAALAGAASLPCLAAVMLPRRPELLAAMMGILRAGSAFLLLPADLPANRVDQILQSSEASVLFTDSSLISARDFSDLPLKVIDVDTIPDASIEIASVKQEDLAYVVYTSGSTGTPKGVEISRRSLLNLAAAMKPVYGKGAVLSICSIGFDAFLLESAAALFNGQTVLLPEANETEQPDRIADLIRGYGVGFISTTPSRLTAMMKNPAFSIAVRRIESIVCGGEAFPPHLLHQLQLATDARIYNQYGPSEATVGVSIKLLNNAESITAGKPMQNCRLYILDAWKNPLPVGVYGNLYIGGECVGIGYRNMPMLTQQHFIDSPFNQGERLYDTGDIACWTSDGEIILGGRADNQIKLRGLRVEPQEAAACISRHPLVKQCAVTVRDISGQTALAAYYTSDEPIPETELRSFAASYLPWYMVPAVIMRVPDIPLTGNGKVNEKLLPEPVLTNSRTSGSATDLEKAVLDIFSQVLGRHDMDTESDYFLCGGNSLNAMETISLISENLGFSVKISDLYVFRTAKQLAAMLGDHEAEPCEPARLSPSPAMDRYPLSPVQQGIYVQSCIDPTGTAYQMPGAFVLPEAPDADRLEAALRALVKDEKLLQTAFVQEPDGVFAKVMPDAEIDLKLVHDAVFKDECAEILAPFELDKAPLMRAKLLESGGEWTLLINIHHIIGDGLTTPILMRRLDDLYQGRSVPALSLSYLDYAWYRSCEEKDAGRLEYWKSALCDLPEPMELPADFKRPRTFDYSGSSISFSLDKKLSEKCESFCRELGISVYMLSLGAFGLVMSHLSGKDDIIVGAPAAGRTMPETRDMCGPFINTLPLRLTPSREKTVRDYLISVRDTVNGMLDHQYVGLEEISTSLGLSHTLSQSPLFSVMFNQRPVDPDGFSLGGKKIICRPVSTGTAKMDLVFELAQDSGVCTFNVEYASSLFEADSVRFWCRCMTQIIKSMTSDADIALGNVVYLSPADRIALIDIPEHTTVPFLNMPIHNVFEQQLELDPDADALIFHDRIYSRAELDRMACRIANLLVSSGARPGGHVGLALRRGPELAAAMLGILKAGCAYVPLMVSLPEQRLRYMIETAQITHVLCSEKTVDNLPKGTSCIFVDVDAQADDSFDTLSIKDSSHCHILFTSGSTGKPKGVTLCHRSVSNMFLSIREQLERASGPILCSTNIGFDTFITETLLPLAIGKKIVVCDEEEMMLPWKVAEIIQKHGVEIVQFTPARFQMLLSNDTFCNAAKGLKLILFGGEVVTPQLLEKCKSVSNAAVVNMYGPTEATVYITMTDLDMNKPITVGKPLKNGRIYILDDNGNRVMPTACGELWIAGEVLSEGYISNPELTEKMFRPDPFFPGERMYRTGDIARLKTDGSYDFLGRRDSQVKLNGQRVELDEITGAVIDSGFALLAATVPVRHRDMSMHLCTFYQPDPAKPGSTDDIVSYLKGLLPAYMIPSRIISLDQMPYTSSSKIDIRALREMAESGDSAVAASPADIDISTAAAVNNPNASAPVLTGNALEDLIKAIWSRILGRSDVRTDVSFFDQGGTSLAALSVLSQYHNNRLIMSMQQFYENTTISAQCALLSGKNAPLSGNPDKPLAALLKTHAEDSTPGATPSRVSAPPDADAPLSARKFGAGQMDKSAALLTGATGFMGAHVLRALIDDGAEHVICIIRGKRVDRLWDTLRLYFGDSWVENHRGSVEVVSGDMTLNKFGLSAVKYRQLCDRISAVWHCAADVRHYAADRERFLAANITGTENAIKLAMDAGASLYHMSTASISGSRLNSSDETAVFTENDFDIGQDWDTNIYISSKFLAERAVFDAANRGLDARIFRLGRLVGRSSNGLFQKNPETDAFWLILRGVHALGAIPADFAGVPIEMTPIDWAAAAVVSLKDSPLTVYHILSPAQYTMEQAARAVSPDLEVLSAEEFENKLEWAMLRDDKAVLASFLDFLQRMMTSPQRIEVSNDATIRQLDAAGFREKTPELQNILGAFKYDDGECLY